MLYFWVVCIIVCVCDNFSCVAVCFIEESFPFGPLALSGDVSCLVVLINLPSSMSSDRLVGLTEKIVFGNFMVFSFLLIASRASFICILLVEIDIQLPYVLVVVRLCHLGSDRLSSLPGSPFQTIFCCLPLDVCGSFCFSAPLVMAQSEMNHSLTPLVSIRRLMFFFRNSVEFIVCCAVIFVGSSFLSESLI